MADPERADSSDMESVEEDDGNVSMFRPEILAALRNRLCSYPDIDNFPEPMKRRIRALKRLQLTSVELEAKFYEEVHALEAKYHEMNKKVYEKRADIVSGSYEPNDEECDWELDCDEDEEITKELKEKAKIEDAEDKKTELDENTKGIPDFWLTIFKNVAMLSEMLQEHDEPILKHLQDIKIVFLEGEDMGFILEFYFEPNEYFTNTVLTKKYLMKCIPEKDEPFEFEGPEIYKSIGCTIDWKKGKNVTVKTVKKNQKHKSRGAVRTITKTVQNDSFFNFFAPPIVPDNIQEQDLDDDLQALLTSDYEIGHYFRERIVPRAVLYYTGEGLEDEAEDYEDEEDDEDEEDETDEDEEEENDSAPVVKSIKGGKKVAPANPQECRQQ